MTHDDPSFDTIFSGAIEIASGEERAAFVARACGTDEELRRRVERLVDAHFQAGSFLESPPASPTASMASASPTESSGTVIGPYKLLQPIGEGGMGTVYMAEQTQPVRRTVALKLIKAGMDSRQVLARFGAERQALALMDHPNIAKVLDAGTTDAGRPYFVMELVKGIPITRFCDERRLTLRERLELAIPVCQAVQHAHQKGIIHRDLKPSNVLIALYDGKPVPKVIDFGVAKATGPRLTDQTLYTEFGAVVGTLEYMSPEQAELNQLDIDTRSDIYSLGVLLYELLTGSTPLERKRLKAGGVPRNAAGDPRGGVAAAEHAALDDRGAAVDRGVPAHRAAEAERAGAGRARLDRDEGAGEGPQPAVRDGQRPGGRPAALPGRRAGAGVPAVGAGIASASSRGGTRRP